MHRPMARFAILAVAAWLAGTQVQRREREAAGDTGKPGSGLLSQFATDLNPEAPLPEHPRPQMVRENWTTLNGLWDYAITPAGATVPPNTWDGKIVVPFPIESALSGVQKPLSQKQRLWYRQMFQKPANFRKGGLLLHFGAVDWQAEVFVNGEKVGEHTGGFDPFSFDITQVVREGENELVVAVRDPTTAGTQPVGKQRLNPEGIFYTPVSGIWQTVWLEVVPTYWIGRLQITPDLDNATVSVLATMEAGAAFADTAGVEVVVLDGEQEIGRSDGAMNTAIEVGLTSVKPWTPDNPFLYGLRVTLKTQEPDIVTSYFAMRKISLDQDEAGVTRIFLNNQPLFMFGLLDQGWWPDGLYTAPTDEALRYDIEMTKAMGFNLARKHVKVESARWYYWADKLGLLVWQDFPASFAVNAAADSTKDPEMPEEARAHWHKEYRSMIDHLGNHPCIVAWMPFNEGWGQHDTNHVIEWTRTYDPTRLVGGPSGWADRGMGDLHDMHSYPGPSMFEPKSCDPPRASVLGEFGGLGLPLEGHLWKQDRNWGYRNLKTRQELELRYAQLISELRPLIRLGLAGAVYTQTTDVETEVNGLMTYDRRVVKIDAERLRALHAPLHEPVQPAERIVLLPTSESEPQTWLHTTDQPSDDWMKLDFDDGDWRNGFGGFGTEGTPGAAVRTEWNGPEIWLRRSFELEEAAEDELYLRIHHDEDAEIYLNGRKVREVRGYSTSYRDVLLDAEARTELKEGRNLLAIHCRQTDGGQYIDAGLVALRSKLAKPE